MEAKRLIQSGFENVTRATDRALEGLTAAELTWQPKPDANSIGLILYHMTRSEDRYIQFMIQQKTTIWETEKWYDKLGKEKTDTGGRYTAEQVASFRVPNLKDLQEYRTAVRQKTFEFVNTLTPEKLDIKVELPPMGPPPGAVGQSGPPRPRPFEPIVGSLLMHTLTHLAEHAGEISYLRGLQRGMDK